MAKKYKIPKSITSRIQSAESFLVDADSLPGAFRHNATRYLLYIRAWELWFIADAKFAAWVNDNKELDPRVLKDHGYKLEKSPPVEYIEVVDHKAVTTTYKSKDQKTKLLKQLIYGEENKSREEIFFRGWFFDTFHREVIGKVGLLKATIDAIEALSS